MKESIIDLEGLKQALVNHAESFSIVNESFSKDKYIDGIKEICDRFRVEGEVRQLKRYRHLKHEKRI